jgi:hypothetical protein
MTAGSNSVFHADPYDIPSLAGNSGAGHRQGLVNLSQRTSPADEIDKDHDYCDYKENVNEPAQGERSDEPEGPQYEQNDSDRIEHDMHLIFVRCTGC